MRHVVTVTNQSRTMGDRWITEEVNIFGPFYTSATAQDFARRAATGAQRKRFSMSMMHEPVFEEGVWIMDNFSSRTLVTAQAIRPSSIRSAWASIREFYNDRRVA